MNNEYLAIGEILKPQGVKGEIKVRPITSDIARFDALERAYFVEGNAYKARGVSLARRDADCVYLRVEGVDDRDEAEGLRGQLIYVRREDAIELGEDENFIVDLIGLKGVDDEGREYGILTEVLQPGGNDVYVFREGERETLVPALKSAILKIDLQARVMLMRAARLREVAVTDDI